MSVPGSLADTVLHMTERCLLVKKNLIFSLSKDKLRVQKQQQVLQSLHSSVLHTQDRGYDGDRQLPAPYWRRWHANGSRSTRCRLFVSLAAAAAQVKSSHKEWAKNKWDELYCLVTVDLMAVEMFSWTGGWAGKIVLFDPWKKLIMENQYFYI